ncbi:hypothetical protein EWM64_g4361 [Hericium alpestre]|uniref:Peroxisomal membrane protein PEX16 n=1 Tax=Hericium alpestre TaxID=135208 RepID=A0A4Z0A1S0_9AGAM|nr:hypothetical protein EWM64_g4361 [Hericium alpestre]
MPSARAHYESFLIKNVSTIATIESSLRSVSWLLPGRFKDAELASEALAATLNVVSLYHDTLIAKAVEADPNYKPLLPPTAHARYTRAWTDGSPTYKWTARVLELVRFVELLVEMGLQRKAPQYRWRGIIAVEAVKALLRFVLLRITRRPLVAPPLAEQDIDPSLLPASSTSATSSPTLVPSTPDSSPPGTPEHLRNNRVQLPSHPLLASPPLTRQTSPVEDFLLSKALMTSSVKTPTSLVKPLASPKDWVAESLYILRPLIYVILISKSGRKSNRPLMVSLALELISRNIRRTPSNSSALERAEYARRDRDLLWYLLRGSIWETWTKPKLESFADRTAQIPVIGVFGAFLKDWMPLIDEYYYSNSPTDLPPLRRIITGHDKNGMATQSDDDSQTPEPVSEGVKVGTLWVTDGIPAKDNNTDTERGKRKLEGIVTPGAAGLRITELAPGSVTAMHRTPSVDYNILIAGEVIHITEDGVEKRLSTPGDTVIQRGTLHAWRNPGPKWVRWISVIIDAAPPVVNGVTLGEVWRTMKSEGNTSGAS